MGYFFITTATIRFFHHHVLFSVKAHSNETSGCLEPLDHLKDEAGYAVARLGEHRGKPRNFDHVPFPRFFAYDNLI